MNFNSVPFLIFLPIVISVYWILPHKYRKYWLLASSYFFYMYWNPLLILLLVLSTVIDYSCCLGIEANSNKSKVRKFLLMISICMNLGLLFTFKYFNFFSNTSNAILSIFGLKNYIPNINLVLPVGISFYTFQTMSYTIDVYRGDYKAEHDFISFALFVSFFPQLVAGPIETPRHLLPQLKKDHHLDRNDLYMGFKLLLSGFFRKCVIADYCGIFVNSVFFQPEKTNSLVIVLASLLFIVQIYCDFSGYSEIAEGSARLMGIKLVKNFNRPFSSKSYREFFRRWHVSLNLWFTRYLYSPLGGSRRGYARALLNVTIVFGLCGLWHGASWNFVLWGLYAAFFVCLETVGTSVFKKYGKKQVLEDNPLFMPVKRCLMVALFLPSVILFRAETISKAWLMTKRMFSIMPDFNELFTIPGFSPLSVILLLLLLAILRRLDKWSRSNDLPFINSTESACQLICFAFLIISIALSWIALVASDDIATFAYFQF